MLDLDICQNCILKEKVSLSIKPMQSNGKVDTNGFIRCAKDVYLRINEKSSIPKFCPFVLEHKLSCQKYL